MPERKHIILMLALAGVLTLPSAVGAQAVEGHADHQAAETAVTTVEQPQSVRSSVQERRQAMHQRMQEIRATQDPDKRRQLLEAQMQDMEALLDAGVCPQPGGGMMANRGAPGATAQGMMQQRGVGGGMGMQRSMPCGMGDGMQHGRCEQRQAGMSGMGMHGGMACGMRQGGCGHGQPGMDDAMTRRLDALENRVDLLQVMLQKQAR
jgi:hypothetical protein